MLAVWRTDEELCFRYSKGFDTTVPGPCVPTLTGRSVEEFPGALFCWTFPRFPPSRRLLRRHSLFKCCYKSEHSKYSTKIFLHTVPRACFWLSWTIWRRTWPKFTGPYELNGQVEEHTTSPAMTATGHAICFWSLGVKPNDAESGPYRDAQQTELRLIWVNKRH